MDTDTHNNSSTPLASGSISNITSEEYLHSRLDDQIDWYSNKSSYFKKRHIIVEMLVICSSTLIPILTLLNYVTACIWAAGFDVAIAILGGLVAIATGYSKLNKLQENWLSYRAISETLKHEKYLYQAQSGPYLDYEDPFKLLVERAENIISHENLNWTQVNRSQS